MDEHLFPKEEDQDDSRERRSGNVKSSQVRLLVHAELPSGYRRLSSRKPFLQSVIL